ncbi:flagellar biosynthesis regulator FlaF [Yoonia sediminilitoris]|uniref:Flagellar protein FlaF n=1 Tax=Yoonia sediminilitoris TaxID=1286148 RepID=A0A2T6KAB1_9RHOB|nr:flagellar biosynthesis regulator FlaF [Yoonia sediminilitoris]PUB11787.1 flagellar protein FlaF [Yoonia sediminilitoris]RCW91864.1 flagellar protein FlaF [Yoonia sediminilitoris]
MNVIEQARQAYAPTQRGIRTNRSIEAQLISQITARMTQAAKAYPENFPALVSALDDNRRMWRALAIDVADDDNGLPQALRAQLFYLAEFTEQHSRKVLERRAGLEALIDINTAVLRGLNGHGAA